MRYERVALAGLAHELPPREVTSAVLEAQLEPLYARLGLHAGRLELMTGIRARRFWTDGVLPSEVAGQAGKRVLQQAGFDPGRIGCLIHASVCRDALEPATAHVVHEALGLSAAAVAFDVSNACLGVLNGMVIVANMVELGHIQAGLVVSGENGGPLVESTVRTLLAEGAVTRRTLKDHFASLTIGSGAAAVLLCRRDLAREAPAFRGVVVKTASEHHALCRGGAFVAPGSAESGLRMRTDSEALLHAGVGLARSAWRDAQRELGFAEAPLDRFITHQVGRSHHRALLEALDLDPERTFTTFETLGNVGSASWPITLSMAMDAGFVAPEHCVAVLGIGSGVATIMARIGDA